MTPEQFEKRFRRLEKKFCTNTTSTYITSMEEGDGTDPANIEIQVNGFGGIIDWRWDIDVDLYPDGLLRGTLPGGFKCPMSAWLVDGGTSDVIMIGIVGQTEDDIWLYTGAPSGCCERFQIKLVKECGCHIKGFVGTPDTQSIALEFTVLPANANLVSTWNTFFNLPANGKPFQNVRVASPSVVILYGPYNANILLPDSIFENNDTIVSLSEYHTNVITSIGKKVFKNCINLGTISLPSVTTVGEECFKDSINLQLVSIASVLTVGDSAFSGCIGLLSANLYSCTALGSTVGDNNVFFGITGNTISLTIATAMATIDAGAPDGDIVYLAANNIETIIYV